MSKKNEKPDFWPDEAWRTFRAWCHEQDHTREAAELRRAAYSPDPKATLEYYTAHPQCPADMHKWPMISVADVEAAVREGDGE